MSVLYAAALWTVACPLLVTSMAHADPNRRTLFILAHQDDDIGVAARVADRFAAGEAIRAIYLTGGDAGLGCAEYVRSRAQGMRNVYAELAGFPAAPDCEHATQTGCWSRGALWPNDKYVQLFSLRGTQVSLAFMGFPNPDSLNLAAWTAPTLERLWSVPHAHVATLELDGRPRTDVYTKEDLIEALRQLVEEFAPTHLRAHDPDRSQPLVYPFDHTDHVHAGLFTVAALQRYPQAVTIAFERGYNAMLEPENRSPEQTALANSLAAIYEPYDAKICTTDTTILCGTETPCFAPEWFDFEKRHDYIVEVAQAQGARIGTPGGLCLTGQGDWVIESPCSFFFPANQRWNVHADGRLQHAASGKCLTEGDHGSVTLGSCSLERDKRFLLLSNGNILGPEARCLTATFGVIGLEGCGGTDPRQTGFALR